MRRCRCGPVVARSAESDAAARLWGLWVVVTTTPVADPENGVAADDALLDQLARTSSRHPRLWWTGRN